MKKLILVFSAFPLVVTFFSNCNSVDSKVVVEKVSYYDVPLVCGAAPHIGCGSRIKPLFMDTEKEKRIKESWTNREGTVIAIVWKENEDEKLIQSLFAKNDIEATLIKNPGELKKISSYFREERKWLRGMDVDQLSIEEAGVIAENLTEFALFEKLITQDECMNIRKDLEEYFKKELVIVRTEDELRNAELQERWMRDGYNIYEKHIGKERADAVSEFYAKYRESIIDEGSCCDPDEADDCCKKKKAA